MAKSPTVVIIGAPEREDTLIRGQLGGMIEVISSEVDPERGLEVVRREVPNIVLLYLDAAPAAVLDTASKIAALNGCAAVIVSRDRNPDNILQAMRSGARDYAFLEDEGIDVRRVLLNLSLAPGVSEEAAEPRGMVIAVFSAKGGSGATTIAANLAGAMIPEGSEGLQGKVALLDIDLQMGDVLAFLDLSSRYTWKDLAANLHRLDEDLLYKSLTLHPSGLHVVAQSDVLEEAEEVKPASVGKVITFLRKHFDFIVIDGLRSFDELSLVALDLADRILLTLSQDIPALKNANRCLAIFRQLGYDSDKVKLVLNRYHKRGDLDLDSVADALGMPVEGTVSNDFPTAIKAVNEGSLLVDIAPRARITKDIRALMPIVRGERPRRRGIFGRRRV
jgi:pilus assembly protein CpaE